MLALASTSLRSSYLARANIKHGSHPTPFNNADFIVHVYAHTPPWNGRHYSGVYQRDMDSLAHTTDILTDLVCRHLLLIARKIH